jgi:hypothetical protein
MRLTRAAGTVVAALLLVFVVGGDAPGSGVPRLSWRSVPLAGAGVVLREMLRCGGRWYALGSTVDGGVTRPAVWRGATGRRWHRLPMRPVTYYGHRHTMYAGACHDGRLAALGAAIGGVHAMPRTSNWYQQADGTLVEVHSANEQYGGPNSIAVARMAGGPAGWLAVGDWLGSRQRAGAAVWWSRHGVDFHRVTGTGLASRTGEEVGASDAIAVPGGWLLVGSRYGYAGRLATDPVWWTSPDGRHWRRHAVPAGGCTFQRVARGPRGTYAVGPAGAGMAAWRRTGTGWRRLGGFDTAAGVAPTVQGFAALPAGLLATAPVAGRMALWASATGARWTRVPTPATVPVSGDTRLLVAGSGGTVLLAADTGHGTRLWRAELTGTGTRLP